MFAFVVAAALASGSPSANSAAPLREVVYKVSYTQRAQKDVGAFGGYDNSPNAGAENGGAPIAQRGSVSDEGTVTVDVMAVANNALGVKLSESWRLHPRPQIFQGSIAPDGSLNFGTQPISEVSASLLPFFGPLVSNGQQLDPGTKWTVLGENSAVSVSTTYSVKSVNDSGVVLDELQTIKTKGALGMDSSVGGTIVYLPSKLVPISGKLTRHSSRSGASTTDIEDLTLNFERTSDTNDKGT